MTRIRQIRDVIIVRQQEELERSSTYKEIEVRAITGAIHAAAGNKRGAANAQKFSFTKKKAKEIPTAKAGRMFPVDSTQGLISQAEIDAEIARLRQGVS